jgi:predicted nuclease with TOPRIM domain
LANSAYYKGGQETLRGRDDEITSLNEKYDELIQDIEDPQPDFELEDLPVMAAGLRALDVARWEFQGALEVREMIGIS